MALLILPKGRLCVSGQKQMCHLCVWKKLFLKNLRWKKIKIQKRWLLGRLSDGSFVPSLYVYFCRSFLLCRLLGLQVIESREGISPSRSHGTVREPLDSYGSSCSITKVRVLYGFTNSQCGKSKGDSLNFLCNHRNDAFL